MWSSCIVDVGFGSKVEVWAKTDGCISILLVHNIVLSSFSVLSVCSVVKVLSIFPVHKITS